jgi:hypothetical protein
MPKSGSWEVGKLSNGNGKVFVFTKLPGFPASQLLI